MAKNKQHEFDTKENGKNDTGRPTLYKPEYSQGIVDYFKNAPKTERVLKSHTIGKNEYVKDEYETIPCELPTITKYAIKIDVSTNTIYQWEKLYEEFHCALERCRDIYKNFLNDNGLCGYYNPLYTKFVATNTTDMKDKTEADVTLRTFEQMKKQTDKYGFSK
jgi:hypothetical protein